jgi:hypothetical protein
LYDQISLCGRDVCGGRVGEAVGALYVCGGPEAGAVVVVHVEEGGCVEAGDVVLLCDGSVTCQLPTGGAFRTSHMARLPVCVWRNHDVLSAMCRGCVGARQ